MKTKALLLFGLLFFFSYALFAQTISESEVPQDVFISFKYKYPDAEVNGWEKADDNYLAKFKLNDQAGNAEFTSGGKWIRSSFTIADKELPSPIGKYIKANYPDHTIRESNFVKSQDATDSYCIVLKEQGIKDPVILNFDIQGTLISKTDVQENKANQVKKENINGKENGEVKTPPQQTEVKKQDDGEPVDAAKVPALAKTHFASKNKKATEVNWFRKEKDYQVKFTLAGRKGFSKYSEEGNWKETRIDADPATLSPVILDYLKSNLRKLKITKAEYVQVAPKSKFYEVSLVEKSSKIPNPPVTKVFFDGNGKYQSIEKPDVEEASDNNKDQEEADKEFMANVDKSNQTIETGTGVNDAVNPKELPTDALAYIKKSYPEHVIKTCRYLFDDDLNAHVYYVTVKKEGVKYEIELYFDLAGKLLKKLDPAEQKYQQENPDGSNNDQKTGEVNTSENDLISGGAESINPKELPSGITAYLKKNFPDYKVDEALYTTDDEFGNVYYLLLKRSGEKTPTELWFDLNGKLVKSEIPE